MSQRYENTGEQTASGRPPAED
ncbi:rCG35477 [Rattus norvegicus]|uniref:RCG35477 n=1 Tax=Rattus norvegicus TaxID=10116 RepID=A6HEP2_RAT|nr:rCG35477 [Rattus norvegicus]